MNGSDQRYHGTRLLQYCRLAMNKLRTSAILAVLLVSCEPGDDTDGKSAKPPGVLGYGGQVGEIYRDGRVDVVPISEPNRGRSCGDLTDRAFQELEDALGALDPAIDYGFERSEQECSYTDSPAGQVHLARRVRVQPVRMRFLLLSSRACGDTHDLSPCCK